LRRTSHAVYDTKYHLVGALKYRKWILHGDIQERVKSVFQEIAANYEFEIGTLEVAADHVHIFSSFPYHHEEEKTSMQLKLLASFIKSFMMIRRQCPDKVYLTGYFLQHFGELLP